jgi:hypothetical protein
MVCLSGCSILPSADARADDVKLKHEYSNDKLFVESSYNVATFNTNAVFAAGEFNLGVSATLDASKGALKTHTAAVNFKHKASTINVGVFVLVLSILASFLPGWWTGLMPLTLLSTSSRLRAAASSALVSRTT